MVQSAVAQNCREFSLASFANGMITKRDAARSVDSDLEGPVPNARQFNCAAVCHPESEGKIVKLYCQLMPAFRSYLRDGPMGESRCRKTRLCNRQTYCRRWPRGWWGTLEPQGGTEAATTTGIVNLGQGGFQIFRSGLLLGASCIHPNFLLACTVPPRGASACGM